MGNHILSLAFSVGTHPSEFDTVFEIWSQNGGKNGFQTN